MSTPFWLVNGAQPIGQNDSYEFTQGESKVRIPNPFAWLGDAIENKKLLRRFILVWAMSIITAVIIRLFFMPNVPVISSGTATAFSVIVGLLATVIALYKWLRGRDDANKAGGHTNGDISGS